MEKGIKKEEIEDYDDVEVQEEDDDMANDAERSVSEMDVNQLPMYSQFAGKYFSKKKRKRPLSESEHSELSDDDDVVKKKKFKKAMEMERNKQLHTDMLKNQEELKKKKGGAKKPTVLDQMNQFHVVNKTVKRTVTNKKLEYDQAKENLLRAILNYQDVSMANKKSQIVITI